MNEALNLRVAFLTDERNTSLKDLIFKTHFMDMLMHLVNYNLEILLRNKECFKLLTVTSGSISEPPDHDSFPGVYQEENLIFYVSESLDIFQNDFPKEVKIKMKEKAPNLTGLLLNNHSNSSEKINYYIKGTTLIYQIPFLPISKDLYENFIEKKLPVLISAVREIRNLNLCYGSISKVTRDSDKSCKSKVCHINPAYRNRMSPYPMISVNEALHLVLKEISPMCKEIRTLRDCYSFVLAEDVIATEPYPTFPASVKDGYAVIANDNAFMNNGTSILNVVGTTTTGYKPNVVITPGTCARVSTGGVIPEGADAVVQVEDTRVHSTTEDDEVSVEILKKPKFQQDIRSIGSDVTEGEILIPAGKKITAAEIGIMSTCGIQNVFVYRKPLVAVMSTGDEVVEPECPVCPGCIRDSNKNTLSHMLIENRIPFIDVGIAKDNPDDVKSHLMFALRKADIIISTGGVSMGEKDVLKQVLEEDFQAIIHFGRVHMKPGKPTTFSTVKFKDEKKLVFSLPGNPVSACVCFYLFVIPCVRKLMGYSDPEHKPIKVKLGHDLNLDERPEFYRVKLSCGEDGVFIAQSTGAQQSSRLLSMQNADALLVLPPKTVERPMLKVGTLVDAILLKSI